MQERHHGLAIAAVALGLLSLTACSEKPSQGGSSPSPTGSAQPTAAAPNEMNLLIMPDYIDEKIVKDFEQKHSTRVRLTKIGSTEEMESKLAYAGADAQYDVVIMPSQVLPRMVRRGLVRPLDHSKVPNLKNLEPRFTGPDFDDGNKHGVPYLTGTVGILYDKKKFPSIDQTWGVLFDAQKVVGTFELLDEMRDMFGAALKYKGFSSNTQNPEEIRAAGAVLKGAKSHAKCLGFKPGLGAIEDVKAGSVDMIVMWNGDGQKAVKEDKDQRLGFMIPREGSVVWVDVMTVTSKSPNPDMAHRFINFMLTPEAGSQLAMYMKYATPNAAAREKLPDEDRNNQHIYMPAEVTARLEHHKDLGEAAKIYDEVWTDAKSQ